MQVFQISASLLKVATANPVQYYLRESKKASFRKTSCNGTHLWCDTQSWIQCQISLLWMDHLSSHSAWSSVFLSSPQVWTEHHCRPGVLVPEIFQVFCAPVTLFHAAGGQDRIALSLHQHHPHFEWFPTTVIIWRIQRFEINVHIWDYSLHSSWLSGMCLFWWMAATIHCTDKQLLH